MSPFVIPLASAETVCSTAISTPVFIRAEGLNEELADVTFTCQGASAAFANIQMFLSPGLPIRQREMNVPAALELSRSGEGAHVWTFFSAPLPAILARKLVAGLVTRTMQRRHQISLRSYDRGQLQDRFPNQFALSAQTRSSSRRRVCRKPCWTA
ncbi:MAG TPA: hypothetical protein VNH18_23925 [Bryobacteraceae bacterium]|nr:hypothetical protein [Bryobacteraceae bacterium]